MIAMVEKKKRGPGRPKNTEPPLPIQVLLSPAMVEALRQLCEQTRRSRPTEMRIALEEYLAKHGLWPPAESSG